MERGKDLRAGGRAGAKRARAVPWRWAAAYLAVAAALAAAGTLFALYLRADVRRRAQEELSAVADLKVEQIGNWLDERLADAGVAAESPFFSRAAERYLADPSDTALAADLLSWMRSRMEGYGYSSTFLLDANGGAVLSLNPRGDPVGEYAREFALDCMAKGEPAVSDLHRGEGDGDIHMDLVAPLAAGADVPPTGALVLRIDPADFLYPSIQSWPTPSDTAETLLVRREGEEVVFLNELRHRSGTALALRLPVSEEDLPATRAARGEEGVFEGTDYRGAKVLAATRSVPGTSWYLVAKEDTSEVYSPMALRVSLVVALTVIVVLALGAAMALAWTRRQARLLKRQAEIEAERAALARHYEHLTRYANDIIILMDTDGKIVEANVRAVQAYGYSREELIGMPVANLRSPAERPKLAETVRDLDLSNGTLVETEHMRRDGTTFPVEISARVIEVDGNRFYQGIVRDVSERRRLEAELRASEEMYRLFFRRTPIGVFHYGRDLVITDCNDRFVDILESSREKLVGLDMNTLCDHSVLPAIRAALEGIEGFYEGPYSATTSEAHIYVSMRTTPLRDAEGAVIGGVGIVEDVSERKRMEAELRASEERFRQLFYGSPVGVFLYGRDLVITDCNERFLQVTKGTRESIVGLDMHGLRDKSVLPALQEALAGKNGRYEGRYTSTTGGVELWISLHTAPLVDDTGKVAGAIATLEDVSEQHELQERLAERELFLRRLTDNMLDLISQVDVDGNFVYLSPSNEKVLGYREGELLGHNVMELVHPDDLPLVAEAYARSTRELVPGQVEFRAKKADGSYVWVESVGNPLYDEAGELIGAIFVTRDISERKRAEERLERLNRCFLELGTDPLENIVRIVDTGKEILEAGAMHYSRLDQGTLSIYHTAKGGAGFEPMDEERHLLCREVIVENRDQPVSVEDLGALDYAGFIPEVAEEGFASYFAHPVKAHGRTVGALGLLLREKGGAGGEERDLVGLLARAIAVEEERLAHEEELRDFVDIASHELRHPMTIIKGYSSMLLSHEERMDERARREALQDIRKGVDRLESLVQQLLETARIERRKLGLAVGKADVSRVAEEVVEEMRESAPDRSIGLRISGTPRPVTADAERVGRVMVILLENAVNYSPPGSPVEVELSYAGSEGVTVSVLDRGWGVPEEDRERIFERFFQVGDVRHHSSEGIGLGLHIAREIVHAHGGRIWHEPREGGGSIFRFTLP